MSSQVKRRLRSNLVPVDNQTGTTHVLTAINLEEAYILTLVSAHKVEGRMKFSHNLIFWEWCLKLGWDKGYELSWERYCHIAVWCIIGGGGRELAARGIISELRALWANDPASYQEVMEATVPPLHPPTVVLHLLNGPLLLHHTKEIKNGRGTVSFRSCKDSSEAQIDSFLVMLSKQRFWEMSTMSLSCRTHHTYLVIDKLRKAIHFSENYPI